MKWLPLFALIAACGFPPLENQPGGDDDQPPQPGCAVPVSYGSPAPSNQEGFFLPGDAQNADVLEYDGLISSRDLLFVYLVSPAPQFPNGFVPKTIQLTGAETDFSTCSGCVVIGAGCQGCAPEAAGGTGTFFMVSSGSLTITAVSPTTIKGTLTNAKFSHVNIANSGTTPTFATTRVADGCDTEIQSLSFTSTVTTQ